MRDGGQNLEQILEIPAMDFPVDARGSTFASWIRIAREREDGLLKAKLGVKGEFFDIDRLPEGLVAEQVPEAQSAFEHAKHEYKF